MKDKFVGYIPYDDKIFKDLWDSSTFVVDANILLNLYRYTKDTQTEVINCLDKISERLWIPYNTADEYIKNRISVISDQQKIYEEIKRKVDFSSQKKAIENIRHVTINPDIILKELNDCEEKINNILEDYKINGDDFFRKDTVLEKVLDLFNNKVGEKVDEKRLDELKKEIDERYASKIPPGYEDEKKDSEKKYGDCINWFSIINYAKEKQCNIIYITDDTKEDWISRECGKTLGPRAELLSEFYYKTEGKRIYIYSTKGFLENFRRYVNNHEEISDKTMKEVTYIDYVQPKDLNEKSNAINVLQSIDDYLEERAEICDRNSYYNPSGIREDNNYMIDYDESESFIGSFIIEIEEELKNISKLLQVYLNVLKNHPKVAREGLVSLERRCNNITEKIKGYYNSYESTMEERRILLVYEERVIIYKSNIKEAIGRKSIKL